MNQSVGENIKRRRKELFLSVDDVAQRTGVSRATWYRYEKGEIEKISTQVMSRIAQVLNTNVSELLGMDFENVKTSLFDNFENKEWNVEYPAGVALSRRKEPVRPSVSLTDGDIAAIAKYLKQQTEEAPVTPEARIVSFGMDQLPQQDRETILNMIRAMFSKRPEAKYFANEEDTSSDDEV